ncbi:ParB/RepB/Spo0J family partition protein [uncultured Desulfovibrio sp.]|uniref:ParB/RepB/Spo0J family partition protein n=1 Tax=uncultured Desulfovibrio sp. TaxID=167968 RepID=UPI002605E78B|nr:ParB/RepB/Spo0J family partition protein [uncultured Desulfovibrio sp.]
MSSKGLGRGLDALLRRTDREMGSGGAKDSLPDGNGGPNPPALLPLSCLHANPNQPRHSFDAEALNELADSIREQGIIQPLLVRPLAGRPGHYQIVAGERRWRAARQAGLGEVPVYVRDLSDAEVMAAALIENLQREDLNPMEEARALLLLRDTLQLTQEALAARLGKSRPAIANALRLLQLAPAAQQDLSSGRISAGHARCLLALGSDQQALAAAEVLRAHIISDGLSVRQAEEAVSLWREEQRLPWDAVPLAPSRPAPATRKKTPQIMALQKSLCSALPCKARINGDMESGRITLRYTSPRELEALLRHLRCPAPEEENNGEAIAAPVDAQTPRQ